LVFAEACYEFFVVDDYGWVAEVAAFAEDVLVDLFFFFWTANVDVNVFEFDFVVFEVLFGHFAPDAGAECVKDNLVLVLFSLDFREGHGFSLGMVNLAVDINFFGRLVFRELGLCECWATPYLL
jgi:hypothetical protein